MFRVFTNQGNLREQARQREIRWVSRYSSCGGFGFFRSEDVPPEQFAPLAVLHFSCFGFHSLANFFASASWAGVILEAQYP